MAVVIDLPPPNEAFVIAPSGLCQRQTMPGISSYSFGAVSPLAAGSKYVVDAVDDAPKINLRRTSLLASLVLRQRRLDSLPERIERSPVTSRDWCPRDESGP